MDPELSGVEYSVGQIVALRANPAVTGAVVRVLPAVPERRYQVFINGKTETYYASQIQAHVEDTSLEAVPLREFNARLTAIQISHPSLSNLYSLHAARVNYVPYQFRPVLRFIRSDRPRLLIADEVGVGKTIEAGLILRELQARQSLSSVLIICPKPLVTERKWYAEMKRFDEEFVALDGPALRHCVRETDLEGEWPERYARAILPFSLFDEQMVYGGGRAARNRKLGLLDLDRPPRFDLVIVDEAHHLRNPNTYLHQGVRFFLENAEAALFLTATPIQLHGDDLFVLLNLLRPDVVIDRDTFQQMSEPNPFINEAVNAARAGKPEWAPESHGLLVQAGSTRWGQAVLQSSPDYQRLCGLLSRDAPSPEERLTFIREAEDLRTFSHLINRTRRRDIGSFTTRKPETVSVRFTPSQQQLHDALLAAQARILRRTHGSRSVNFMMTTLRRQAASCLYGLAPLIRQILTRRMDALEWSEADDSYEDVGEETSTTLAEEVQAVLTLADNLDAADPKLDALFQILTEKLSLPNNKVLLFSSFRHTLRYLHDYLVARGLRVALIHGDIPDEERVTLRDHFSRPKEDPEAVDVLLSSEVGCEGLDYQFCDCLVNYDLPWNPMRVEQRIGRIDRYGQQSETVAIYNLVTLDTVDFDIYERCHLRIGVFRQALGGSEEILGQITRELHAVAENLELTEDERRQRLQQLADNAIRRIQEEDLLEERQAEFFGIRLPQQRLEEEIAQASSTWLTPAAIQNLVQSYLSARCGGAGHVRGEGALKTLRLSQDARSRLLEDFRALPKQSGPICREWEKWLKGSQQHLEITFDAECAAQERRAAFIMPVHPLAQQAARFVQPAEPFCTALQVDDGTVPPGIYTFAVYQWQRYGVRDDAVLQPVCSDPRLTGRFMEVLRTARPVDPGAAQWPTPEAVEGLESEHYRIWSAARAEHRERTQGTAQYRRESLRTSHQSRLALLREQLAQAQDARIRRMREAQIASAEADHSRRLAEIDASEQRADIISQLVALGTIVVEECNG
ncbi:MAG: DEAD/DEAH box helicase family protein [Armatimonadetes bacterium]|nr:DEAD/DEAH box helicase family protein [Armatimonadota bacterium]